MFKQVEIKSSESKTGHVIVFLSTMNIVKHLVSTGGVLIDSIVHWKAQSHVTCWMSTSQTPLSHFFKGRMYLQGD